MRMLNIEKIRDLMVARELNQATIADKIGIDRSSVTSWLKGHKQPTNGNLEKLAEILEVNTDEIVTALQDGIGQQGSPNLNPSYNSTHNPTYQPTVTHITVQNIESLYLILDGDKVSAADVLKSLVQPPGKTKGKKE